MNWNMLQNVFLKFYKNDYKNDLNLNQIDAYLSNAIDKPIPFASNIFILKKYLLYLLPERIYRYIFRCYCRLFDKSVQL